MIRKFTKTAGSLLRDLYGIWRFNSAASVRRYKGVYSSHQAASAALPAGKIHGFDHESVAEFFVDTHFVFNPSDYAILFWLSQILAASQTVFDFGGGVGQCYYLYRRFLNFPEGLHWMVGEVESLASRGQRLAAERKAGNLEFTTEFKKAAGADVFFTAGTLHYIERDLPAMLADLPTLPKHVLVNRVPMYQGKKYFTVQHGEHSYVVNKVVNRDVFAREMEQLGYEKVDQWYLPRVIRIPLHPERSLKHYWGFYFRLKKASE